MSAHRMRFVVLAAILATFTLLPQVFAEAINVVLDFPIDQLSITPNEDYDQITLRGCYIASDVGAPALPQRSVYVSIPFNKRVDHVEVVAVSKVLLEGQYTVYPMQPPVPASSDGPAGFVAPDPAIYGTDTPYPASIVKQTKSGYLAGYRIAGLLVTPFEYKPASKKLTFFTSISLRLDLVPCPPQALAVTRRSDLLERSNRDRVAKLVVNKDSISPPRFAPSVLGTFDTVDCVIITGSSYTSQMEPLADWLIKKGYRTEIHTVSEIASSYSGTDTQERIRNFLKDYYANMGLGWVILGGDTSVVPARAAYAFDVEGDGYTYDDYLYCDYYYADLDGTWNDDGDSLWGEVNDDNIDMFADLLVGRLPFDTTSEAATVVEKTLVYEGVGSTQLPTDYQKKLLMFATQLDSSTSGGDCKDELENYVSIPGDYTITRLYDRDGTSGKSNVINAMNSGYNLINNVGHANYSVMSAKYTGTHEYLYRDDMSGLTNAPRYSILYTIGCWAAAIDYDCIAERFVLAPDGGGVAFVGNSRYGWYSSGYPGYGPSDAFDQEFFSAIFDSGTFELGAALSDSKQVFASYAKGSYSSSKYYRWILYELNLLGSPTTPVWTDTPSSMSASYDTTLTVGQTEFDVQVESGGGPLQSALVCLYKEDEVFETAETDSSGLAHITLSPPPTSTGTMFVTVTKHNYLPERGSAEVQEGGGSGPELSSGSVSPETGRSSDTFTYCVHYYHADSEPPATADVYIDGSPYTMTLASGDAADGDYEYEASSLSAGDHSFYFYFEDGNGKSDRLPASGSSDGPFVDDTKPSSSCSSPSYSTSQTVSISFTASDGSGCGISETKLYYRFDGGSYGYSGESQSGTSGSFSFSLPDGQGTYDFYTIAIDNAGNVEDAPSSADDTTLYDSTAPVSSCSSPTYGTSPISVTYTASDGGSGLATTKLYYSYSGGSFTFSGHQSSASSGSFSFVPPDGEGTYSFYTIAIDNAGNVEDAPSSADDTTIYDGTKPSSAASSPTYATSLPITVSFTASDTSSGVGSTELYYSYNSGSYSYSGQTKSGTSGSFSFSPTEGDGTYRFYTIAYDNAGNVEDTPSSADDTTIYDSTRPESSCSSPEYAYSSPITITFTASDSLSGVSTTKLYYRKDGGDYTYSGLEESGTSGSFSFSPPDGDGTYDFYTIATDNAGNTEQAPSSPDSSTEYSETDNTRPESHCEAPVYARSIPIDVEPFASDDKSGVAEVKLYYSFNGGEYKDSGLRWDGESFCFLPPPLHEVFVSPDGSPDATGTIDDPKNLASVLTDSELAAGTIVWLRGGEYSGTFSQSSAQDGTPEHPIIVMPFCGERATLLDHVYLRGDSTYWIGVELTSSGTSGGIDIYDGDDVRLVNLIIHDPPNGYNGIGGWRVGSGHIYYGNLIWGVANDPQDPHGHAIYTQNDSTNYGLKTIRNNILFNNNKFSLHAYCEGGTELSGFRVSDNISFGNSRYFLLGGGRNIRLWDNVVSSNYFYELNSYPFMPGWYGPTDTMTITDNYIVSGGSPAWFRRHRYGSVVTGNTFISSGTYRLFFEEYQDETPQYSTFDWDDNTYYVGSTGDFRVLYCRSSGNTSYSLEEWRSMTGWDANSQIVETQTPSENKTVVLPNAYKIKRAHIAIYNWEASDSVDVDVSSILTEGDYFRLVDVEDYFGEPVLKGFYDGNPLSVPMAGKEFKCFVLSASSFTPPDGEGTYAFYTIATDKAGNTELPPDEPDAVTVYDETAPVSGCSCDSDVNHSPISIAFSSQDETSGVASTRLYYKFNSGSWTDTGQEKTGTSGAFEFTLSQGEGTYYFYTLATDEAGNVESTKEAPDASCVYDTTKPTSSCSCGEFASSLPIVVQFEAHDGGSGLASTKLFYSFEGGDATYSGLEADGTAGSFEFNAPDGQGTYNFYTIAVDAASNEESPPQTADCHLIYDATLPSSSCSSPDYSTGDRIAVSFSASDALSGVSYCDLYYRFGDGEWTSSGLREYGDSGSFSFEPTGGDGTYQFYTIATDRAGNVEGTKSAETTTLLDTQAPASSCSCPSMTKASSVEVAFSASDESSGLAHTKLYYRYSGGDWTLADEAGSDESGTFTFSFADGDGQYDFYTIATDIAGNSESAPEGPDATVLCDRLAPTSECSSPETANEGFEVSYSSDDGDGSGVVSIDLWFRFSYDQGETWNPDWTASGISSSEPAGTFSYQPTLGEGIYEFYTIATDHAGNIEEAPQTADSATHYVTEKPTSSASSPEFANGEPITVSFEARDSSGIKEVQLYYRYAQQEGSGWTEYADSGLRAYTEDGAFDFAAESFYGEGIYQFYTIAVDAADNVEDAPAQADCQTIYDATLPKSYLFSPDYASAASINSVFVADEDLSGVEKVELWFRYSADNGGTFATDWSSSGVFSEATTGVLTFSAEDGDGLYELMTLATDKAGNQEDKGQVADQTVILDTIAPAATVSCLGYATELPLQLDFTATDGTIGSGVASVLFWYRFEDGDWAPTGLEADGTSGTVSFSPSEGDGSYQFFAIAKDAAGNAEQLFYEPEAELVLDDKMPASSAFCSHFSTSSVIEIGYEATGRESGIASVSLFYRFSSDGGASWSPDWTDSGQSRDTSFGSFDFTAEQGEGRYEFYTIAENNAGSVEPPPSGADAWCIYDKTAPSYQLSSPALSNSSPIDVGFEVDDGQAGSGLDSIELYYRFNGGNWQLSGLSSSETAGTFAFTPGQGDGMLEFSALVIDKAGNSTAGSFEVKSSTQYDTSAPSSTLAGPTAVGQGPIQMHYAVSGAEDLSNVRLYYRFSQNCGESWDVPWTDSDLSGSEPEADFTFETEHGEGLYQFRTVAEDAAGNVEQKEAADSQTILDSASPVSLLEGPDCASGPTILLDFTASDPGCGSGIVAVHLFFSSALSDWQEADVGATGTEGVIHFAPPDGEGLYHFYSQAEDAAGNLESTSGAQLEVMFDQTPPESSVQVEPFSSHSPLEVQMQAADATTEPTEIRLYYRFRQPGSGWQPNWTDTGKQVDGASGTVQFDTPCGEGIYELCAIAQDLCGNTEQIETRRSAQSIFDITPPVSTLDGSPVASSSTLNLSFTSSDALSGLNSAKLLYAFGDEDLEPTGLTTTATEGVFAFAFDDSDPQGTYRFVCIGTDRAGNQEQPATDNTVSVQLDTNAPSSRAVAPRFANHLPIEITCSATDGTVGTGVVRVELYYRFGGQDWQFSMSQECSTSATFTFNSEHGNGTYEFFSIATDAAGNSESMKTDADSQTLIDNERPDSEASCHPCFSEAPIEVSYVATTGTCQLEKVTLWYRYFDGTSWTSWADSGASASGITGSIPFSPTLGDGRYEFYTLAEDVCGNVEFGPGIADCTTVYDTTAPTCFISVAPFCNSTEVRIDYECNDGPMGSGAGSTDFWLRRQGGEWELQSMRGYGPQGYVVLSLEPQEGHYDLTAASTDIAGNTTSFTGEPDASFVLDLLPPTSMSTCPQFVQTAEVTLDVRSSDNLSGLDSVQLFMRRPGGAWAEAGAPTYATSASITLTLSGGQGNYEFQARANDRAGNYESLSDQPECSTVYDATPPNASCSSSRYARITTGKIDFEASDEHSGVRKVTLWAAFEGAALTAVDAIDGQSSGSFDYTFTQGEGTYHFAVQAQDAAGNSESAPTAPEASTTLDRTAPQTSCNAPSTTKSSPIGITYYASDPLSGIKQVTLYYRLNAGAWQESNETSTSAGGTISFTPTDGDGRYQFCIVGEDRAGNKTEVASGGTDQTVFDTTPPNVSLSCPEATTTSPIPVQFEAHDALSDVSQVTLYYRFHTKGGTWQSYASLNGASGTFTFVPSHGFGIYEFSAAGTDSLGNQGTPGDIPLCHSDYQSSIPVISPSDSAHDFGEVAIGKDKVWVLKIGNSGGSTLVISEIKTSGDFSCTDTTPITIHPGGTFQLSVKFTPQGVGRRDGWLTITSNDTNTPNCNVNLTGSGFLQDAQPQANIILNGNSFKEGDRFLAQVEAEYSGPSTTADLYVSIFLPGGWHLYCPTFSTIPSPFIPSIRLYPGYKLGRTTIIDVIIPKLDPGQCSFMALFCHEGSLTPMGDATTNSFTIDGPPRLSLSLNGSTFKEGDTMSLSRTIENPGLAKSVDLYVGITLPTGETLFYPSLSETPEPFTSGIPLNEGETVGPTELFSITLPGIEPGQYFWLAVLTPTGEFDSFSNIPTCGWTFAASRCGTRSPGTSMGFARLPRPDTPK